mgnify:CR=1 FL=1
MPPSSFFRAFPSKEALLLELDKRMFSGQFTLAEQHSAARALRGGDGYPAPHRRADRAAAGVVCDGILSAHHRGISLQKHNEAAASHLRALSAGGTAQGLYEMEIASASIMRGFMSVPCDVYFTMDAKISRFLDCSLKLYDVPKEKRAAITAQSCRWTFTQWLWASSKRPSGRRKRALRP